MTAPSLPLVLLVGTYCGGMAAFFVAVADYRLTIRRAVADKPATYGVELRFTHAVLGALASGGIVGVICLAMLL